MDDLVRLLARADKLLRAASDAAMSEHGVRVGQNLVLEALWERDGLTPGEVAARLGLTTPTIVNTATRMEAAGLVVRRRDPADARLVRLYLTGKALRAREPVEEARRRLEERVAAALSEEERRHVRTALEKIIEELA
ncbi:MULTISPECIES: MarR family winged helix-turn-helix transcriptional regulator [Actinomadura]|uniref:DNA-binding transcriptional regulator, MarR family n=2 Tax=Actinomadura madurae TaxID=1993 RepID=A0A1I4VZ74_9ACTN|nr:MarR family transcriptional regulator [Actinomadura madurae]MCP9954336.1 MarR family transcriptional regulator [Actinomadura madurae]URM99831.1 MarR family transcriptional regulator [Actinomadura madurae]URN01994.1 MarR family transcriptional regulator [Actinomadura madurae]SFN06286.1 DNA-binding transcriptional regulator, MarR family [Actinomadura madurae]SPT58250.1 Regulator of autolytic activity [Actinomadura madurae]